MGKTNLFSDQGCGIAAVHDRYKSFESYSITKVRKNNRRNKSQKRIRGGHMKKPLS